MNVENKEYIYLLIILTASCLSVFARTVTDRHTHARTHTGYDRNLHMPIMR